MANTPKIKRRWIKQEKQIVYLLYRKGFIKGEWKLEDLYWAEYKWLNKKCYKTKPNRYEGKRYRFPIYMPEVHYCTTDYWGESDEHSIVSSIKEMLYWSNIDTTDWESELGYPKSNFKNLTREQFIKYLKNLLTKVADRKINKVIKFIKEQ